MPYIAFDLDALNVVPQVADASGLSPPAVTHGLVNLWAYCFRAGTDIVSTTHVRGFFGGVDAAEALVAFKFLELTNAGFRVKGADRYLRVREARSAGGKKAAGNLKRGKFPAGTQPEGSRESVPAPAGLQPEVQPGRTSGSVPALTPSTEHRTPNLKPTSAPPPVRAPDDPLESGAAFFAQVQVERAQGGLPREKPPHPSKLSAWWSEMLLELNGRSELVVAAYRGFARDAFWRDKAPPLPFPGFMSQWRKYVPESAERTAPAA